MFPYETPESGGNDPQPLCLKIAAYLRYLATGAQLNAHEEGSRLYISRGIAKCFSEIRGLVCKPFL